VVAVSLVIGAYGPAGPARACDLCAIHSAVLLRDEQPGFEVGVGQQYSDFGTLQNDGDEVPNPAGERLQSSITQVVLGYNLNRYVGFQLSLPIIARNFRRLEDGRLRSGDETGVGDLSLLVKVRPYSYISTRRVLRVSLFGGLELPSGSTDRLGEELEEGAAGAARAPAGASRSAGRGVAAAHLAPHTGQGEESGVHGHDLALGSGSVDGVVGGSVFAGWRRLFVSVHLQYAIRSEGDFDYRYADDFLFGGGPGAFLLLDDRYTLGLQAALAGETKGTDEQRGERVGDTGLTAVYMGPRLLFTWGHALYADVAGELPVVQNNSGLQIVPDYRIRGGLTWRF
jgi:hypothetical protein